MARPKQYENKKPVNLTISEEAIQKGKDTARALKKSLSQFTEDMYEDMHNNIFKPQLSPEEKLKDIEGQINMLKKQLKGGKNK